MASCSAFLLSLTCSVSAYAGCDKTAMLEATITDMPQSIFRAGSNNRKKWNIVKMKGKHI
jgi:hypothetical protein